MLAFLPIFLLASSSSAMMGILQRNGAIPPARRFGARTPVSHALGFPNEYMDQLEAVKPHEVSSLDQAFYKHTDAWQIAVGEFTTDYWKIASVPALDHAANFKFSESVAKFNFMTNQLRRFPATDPRKLFVDPLYEGRQEHLSKIPVELVFEWMDVLEEMNLRQRSIVVEKEEKIKQLESEKAVQLSRAAELEKTVADSQSEKVRLEAELESVKAALKQAEKTNTAIVLEIAALTLKNQDLETDLVSTKRALEAEQQKSVHLLDQNQKLGKEKEKVTGYFEQAKQELEALVKESQEESKNHQSIISKLQAELVSAVSENGILLQNVLSSDDKVVRLSEDLDSCRKNKAELRKKISELETDLSIANGTYVDPWATGDWRKYQHLE